MDALSLFMRWTGKIGKWTLVVVILLLAGYHWNFVNLSRVVVDILFIYLIINGASATPFIYLERRGRPVLKKFCPKCGGPLQWANFECPTCGIIKFEKQKED